MSLYKDMYDWGAACLKSFQDEFKVNMLLLIPVDLTIDGRV